MPNTPSIQSSRSCRNSMWWLLTLALVLAMALPAVAGDKEKDEETFKNAVTVFQEVAAGDKVPAKVLAQADCILILPGVKKFGFGIGGSGGRGALSCRHGKDYSGKWSAPAMYSIGGASVGAQVGGSSTDFVLLIVSDKGVDAVLHDKTKLGSDAAATAGPSSAMSESSSVGGSDILTYGKAKGMFAGVSISGATLHQDVDANERLYGKKMSSTEIVKDASVKPPAGGAELVALLDSKVPKRTK